ncbi:MAG: PqqD family protein [Bacteroidales bacterium]|nr:PqqD family protein [Bacteroidales bacterium]
MKIKDGFKLRNVMGQATIIGEGVAQVDFNKLITLNSTAAFLWEAVADKEFSEEDLAALLMEEYGIDNELAAKDAASITVQWKDAGLVE